MIAKTIPSLRKPRKLNGTFVDVGKNFSINVDKALSVLVDRYVLVVAEDVVGEDVLPNILPIRRLLVELSSK